MAAGKAVNLTLTTIRRAKGTDTGSAKNRLTSEQK
jgi:hypothetical protein